MFQLPIGSRYATISFPTLNKLISIISYRLSIKKEREGERDKREGDGWGGKGERQRIFKLRSPEGFTRRGGSR